MRFKSYSFLEPTAGSELEKLARQRPLACARMLDAMEAFATDPSVRGFRAFPEPVGERAAPDMGVAKELHVVPTELEQPARVLLIDHQLGEIRSGGCFVRVRWPEDA